MRVEVYDESTRMPAPAARGKDATSRRDSPVEALASSWDTRREGLRKVVWAEFGVVGRRASPTVGVEEPRNQDSEIRRRWDPGAAR